MKRFQVLGRRRWMNWRLHEQLIGRAFIYWCGYHVVLWHVIFLCRVLEYRNEVLSGARPVSFGALYDQFVSQHGLFIWSAIALLPIVFFDLIRQSRRVIGPLHRMETVLRGIARGEPSTRLAIRQDDIPVDLAQAFNEFLDTWNAKQREAVCRTAAISSDAERILSDIHSMQHELADPSEPAEATTANAAVR